MVRKAWQFRFDDQSEVCTVAKTLTCSPRYGTVRNMSVIRGLFWLVLFVFFTFCFVVLFEYGTHDFANGFKKEFERAKTFVVEKVQPTKKRK
jgi:hypothetical protein